MDQRIKYCERTSTSRAPLYATLTRGKADCAVLAVVLAVRHDELPARIVEPAQHAMHAEVERVREEKRFLKIGISVNCFEKTKNSKLSNASHKFAGRIHG